MSDTCTAACCCSHCCTHWHLSQTTHPCRCWCTRRSISPRAVANDNDTAASITFAHCAFVDNVHDTYLCWPQMGAGWFCSLTGPQGAADVTTVSDVTFKGSTVFQNNSWGALFAAGPITVEFQGTLGVIGDSKRNFSDGGPNSGSEDYGVVGEEGGGIEAAAGARLVCKGATTFR